MTPLNLGVEKALKSAQIRKRNIVFIINGVAGEGVFIYIIPRLVDLTHTFTSHASDDSTMLECYIIM